MARRTHAIGYRLGVGKWWKTRTPPQQKKERGIEQIVRGVMERYGYLTSEVIVQKGQGKGAISLVGGRGERIEMYILEYLGEMIKKSENGDYRISYREGEKMSRNIELRRKQVEKNAVKMRRMMRNKKWRLK